MPKYKLIATDLDDTLLNDNIEVSQRNRAALLRAEELGAVVTIATGRMFRSAAPIALNIGIHGPIICYQGALVKNVSTGEILFHRPVPLDLAREVINEGYQEDVHINVYLGDTLYVDQLTEEGINYATFAKVEMNPIGNLLDFLHDEPTKLLYIAQPEIINKLKDRMQRRFGNRLYITKSKPNYLEFMHPYATKSHALKVLAEMYGILPTEIMVFGDSYNDIDMLEYAGAGVAMGNAPEEIKKRANCITDTNNNDGVAKIIEKLVL